MTSKKIVKNQTVLVKGKRIIEIGPSETVIVPVYSKLIDGTGAYLMPGLADMHMHTRDNWDDWLSDWPVSPLYLYLANGVTTIRCFGPKGNTFGYVRRWRDDINKGKQIGPTIYTCGRQLRGPVRNPEDVVQEQKDNGYDFIKLYSFLSKEEFHKALSKAKAIDMYTAGHIPFQVGLDGVLLAGMNEIAHLEELTWEFVDFNRNKNLSGENWLPYVVGVAYQQSGPYLGLDLEELEEKFGDAISSIAMKVKSENVPVCTTIYLDEVIVEKLFEPEHFLSKPENRYLP